MILAKINVEKIDKTKLFKGEKGTYLDLVIIPTPNSKYGDYMIKQSQTKEERDAGAESIILGDGKDYHQVTRDTQTGQGTAHDIKDTHVGGPGSHAPAGLEDDPDLPF